MKRFAILLLLCTATLFKANAQELIVIESPNLKCNDSILVFTPVNVNASENCPTLFLLHGWSGCYSNWSEKYDLQEISNRTNFRIICPDGFYNSWYINNSDPQKMQWRTFFWEECFPMMEKKFNLKPENTFITGLSMGGHGAINIFIDNPDKFKSAGSMSGILDLQLLTAKLKDSELAKVIGDKKEQIDHQSAINRLNVLKEAQKPIIVSCGYDDVFSRCTETFAQKCRYMGVPHFLMLTPGVHSWKFWGYALEEHIAFFKKLMAEENLGY